MMSLLRLMNAVISSGLSGVSADNGILFFFVSSVSGLQIKKRYSERKYKNFRRFINSVYMCGRDFDVV